MHHPKALGGLLAAPIAVAANAGATSAAVPYPRSMAALGDSLTLAYPNTVEESWATGGNPLVRSHYLRILAAGGGAIRGHAYNLAVPGASFLAMQAQVRRRLRNASSTSPSGAARSGAAPMTS